MTDVTDIAIAFLVIMGVGVSIEYVIIKTYSDWKDRRQKTKVKK